MAAFKTGSNLPQAVLSPDGRLILVARNDNAAHLLQADGAELKAFVGHQDRITAAAFNRDGQLIATGSLDQEAVGSYQKASDQFFIHALLAAAYAHLGETEKASAEVQAALTRKRDLSLERLSCFPFADQSPFRLNQNIEPQPSLVAPR